MNKKKMKDIEKLVEALRTTPDNKPLPESLAPLANEIVRAIFGPDKTRKKKTKKL